MKPGTSRKGPPVWICGDCHFGNLGTIADGSDRVAVLIRDLDQMMGNRAHDLIRLGVSVASAMRGAIAAARMIEQMIDGYKGAFVEESGKAESPTIDLP